MKGTLHYGIKYDKVEHNGLISNSDNKHITTNEDGRSTSGNVFYYNEALVSWSSRKQQTVALSSCEAEFMAATVTTCQAIWVQGLLQEITRLLHFWLTISMLYSTYKKTLFFMEVPRTLIQGITTSENVLKMLQIF